MDFLVAVALASVQVSGGLADADWGFAAVVGWAAVDWVFVEWAAESW